MPSHGLSMPLASSLHDQSSVIQDLGGGVLRNGSQGTALDLFGVDFGEWPSLLDPSIAL